MTESKKCKNCIYWNNDNGFCEAKTIFTSSTEICEFYENLMKPCDKMTWSTDNNGDKIIYDYTLNKWVYPDEPGFEYINRKRRRICPACKKPSIDINGICNVDFCLQGLSCCDFISDACCGHNNPDDAYISLVDGRRFVLDKEWSRKDDTKNNKE